MSNRSLSNIYLSAFLSIAATGGGWAITAKLAGGNAAQSFLYISVPTVLGMLIVQGVFFLKSRSRTRFLVLLNISSAFGLLWMMSCLVLPIFWISHLDYFAKLIFALISIFLCWSNIIFGIRTFDKKWENVGVELLRKYYRRDCEKMDWEGLVASLRLSVSFRLPGLPEKINPILSVILVVSMVAGLSLRSVFPIFSIFAWAIPSVVVIATVLQMIGFGVGQFFTLSGLEKKDGVIIRPL